MKAITQDRYGSTDFLEVREIEQPRPGDLRLFVRVQAAGIAPRALNAAGVAGEADVLIVGASRGVGTYAVQIAVAMGATLIGVASGSAVDLVTALGARHFIDYAREDFAAGSRRYDVVVDIGGMTPVSRLRSAVQPKGTLVILSGSTWSPGMGRQLKACRTWRGR